jgi:hypothetical protein
MKMKKMIFLMLTLLIMGVASMNAQVTIGSENLPHSGAVLDLQSDNLGLKLPNVALGNDLTVFKLPVTAESTKEKAKGMYVYNTNPVIGEGVYVWDGGQWIQIKETIGTKPVTKITIIPTDPSYAVLSYTTLQLNAEVIPEDASNSKITWSISGGSGSANISNTGLLTAGTPGRVIVRATASNGVSAICEIYVYSGSLPITTPLVNGSHSYQTYNFNGDVWMVENAREGVATASMYDSDASRAKGFYYTHVQANTNIVSDQPCKDGWHLPNAVEGRRLFVHLETVGLLTGEAAVFYDGNNRIGRFYEGVWSDWGRIVSLRLNNGDCYTIEPTHTLVGGQVQQRANAVRCVLNK